MTRYKKTMHLAIVTGFLACLVPPQAFARTQPNLTVYAGPQSVSPHETIYVSVEVTAELGEALKTEDITLTYISDGVDKTLSGRPKHGLISFDVPAQKTVGVMKFYAATSATISKEALVTVVAGQAQPFAIQARRGQLAGSVKLTSDKISDQYGNPLSDLSLVSIEWLNDSGLIARQSVHLLNGRIALSANCPTAFSRVLNVRASVSTIVSPPLDIATLCDEARG